MARPSAIIVGVGAEHGLGAAVARRFAAGGHHVYVCGRTTGRIETVVQTIRGSGGSAQPVATDTTREDDVLRLFDLAFEPPAGIEPPDVVVYNAGNNRKLDFRELSAQAFEEFWRIGCLGGFLVGREAARRLVPLARGTVLFTGASGSLRGKPGFAHFAAAKAGLRMISQSMAREFGPLGIHVAHVVIDGGIHGERLLTGRPQILEQRGADGLLDIDAIAENYWHLYRQPRTAWAQEIDLRPYKEPF
jgi:NAD(P)-dependent dehydrogenase (short-subunit alcohol dehydrogenase family)